MAATVPTPFPPHFKYHGVSSFGTAAAFPESWLVKLLKFIMAEPLFFFHVTSLHSTTFTH
jgi:hypothetical protein